MTPLDLSALPLPDVVEAFSFEEIKAAMVADLEARNPGFTAVLESDPAMKLVEAGAYREMLIRQRVNDAARQTFLASATGRNLEAIGALFNVERLTGESDQRFRTRVQSGFLAVGAAGPSGAYRAHTLGVSPAILDATADLVAPGQVAVTVFAWLEKAADTATDAEIRTGRALFDQPDSPARVVVLMPSGDPVVDAVRIKLNADKIKPMTDGVVVGVPQVLEFNIAAGLVILPGPDAATVLARAKAALAAYLRRVRLVGYDATRAGITAALMVPGVQNVFLDSPAADVTAGPRQMVAATRVNITVAPVRDV